MSDPLVAYLNDHLSGGEVAVQVLEAMRDQNNDPMFREFADALLPEIKADHANSVQLQRKLAQAPARSNKPAVGFSKNSHVSSWGTPVRQTSRCSNPWNSSRSAHMVSIASGKPLRRHQGWTLGFANMTSRHYKAAPSSSTTRSRASDSALLKPCCHLQVEHGLRQVTGQPRDR